MVREGDFDPDKVGGDGVDLSGIGVYGAEGGAGEGRTKDYAGHDHG